MISVTTAQLNAWLAAFAWPLARILALFASAPIIGNPSLPVQIKIGLAFLMTILVAPLLPPPPDIDPASAMGLLILAQQMLIGLAMGFAMQIVFQLGQFMGVVASLTFLAIDGHLLLLSSIVGSFDALPIAAHSASSGLRSLVEWAGVIFSYALTLSLPLMAALLITNLALGVLTRAAPQLNIFAVGFPVTILMGFLVLVLSLPYFAPVLEQLFRDGFDTMFRLAGALRVK
ncbi:MAG: flagellar biosynthetic protein FliR [Proteobacteria bacterium]|nr:flagellar biosynthetic protein FliR [Pseudomonadota bacterium]